MFRAAADRGRIVLAGTPSAWPERGPRADIAVDEFLRREVSLVGSYETGMTRPHPYWPWSRARNRAVVLDLIARHQLDVKAMVTHVVPHTEAPAMYDMMMAGPRGWNVINFVWERAGRRFGFSAYHPGDLTNGPGSPNRPTHHTPGA